MDKIKKFIYITTVCLLVLLCWGNMPYAEASGTVKVTSKEVFPGNDVDLGVVTIEVPPGALNTGDTFVLSLPERLSFNTTIPVVIRNDGNLTLSTVNIVHPPGHNGRPNAITGNLSASYSGPRDVVVSLTAQPNSTDYAFLYIYLMGVQIPGDYKGTISVTINSNRGWPGAALEAEGLSEASSGSENEGQTTVTGPPQSEKSPVSAPLDIDVRYKVGESSFIFNGKVITMDVIPFVRDGRTYVPVRYIANAVGVPEKNISFRDGVVTFKFGDSTTVLTPGSNIIVIDGKATKMDVPVLLLEGRTFVPLRWLCESFRLNVGWDQTTQTISIQ